MVRRPRPTRWSCPSVQHLGSINLPYDKDDKVLSDLRGAESPGHCSTELRGVVWSHTVIFGAPDVPM